MQRENFEEVDGYENYQVSDEGRIHNVKHGREIKSSPNTEGYLRVRLYNKGVSRQFLVHRLVAEAFLPDWDSRKEVKHLNRNIVDNRVENLMMGEKKARRPENSVEFHG